MCTLISNKLTAALLLSVLTLFSKYSTATQFGRTTFGGSRYVDSSEGYHDDAVIAFPGSYERSNYQQFHHNDYYYPHPHQHTSTNPLNNYNNNNNNNNNNNRGYQMKTSDDLSEGNSRQRVYRNSSVPIDLFWKMNNFTDLNDLLLNFVEDLEEDAQLESRFSGVERTAAIVPKPAACIPEMQTVQIAREDDPSVIFIPSCTRIERCGGCCSHNLFSCQATDTETISFQVVKTQFMGGSKLKYMGKEIKLVEKHTKCKCDCKIKKEDCNRFQEYRKSECRCMCINSDEEKKCYKENATKLWNPDICACQCRNILQCSTGYTFDMLSCKCVPVLVRRRFAELEVDDVADYKVETLPLVPNKDARNVET